MDPTSFPEWQNARVTSLAANECFVFGSNRAGFHGAGAAGFAHRGSDASTWRLSDQFKEQIMLHRQGVRGDALRGRWTVFGQGQGHQQGTHGQSYAVTTVQRPGQKRSVTRREIYAQLLTLRDFSLSRPDLVFLITPLGEGLAGYTEAEMAQVWQTLAARTGPASNWRFVRHRP